MAKKHPGPPPKLNQEQHIFVVEDCVVRARQAMQTKNWALCSQMLALGAHHAKEAGFAVDLKALVEEHDYGITASPEPAPVKDVK